MNKKLLISLLGVLLLGTIIVVSGCSEAKAKNGDTVKVNYTGTLSDGTVFDSSVDREPLEFTIGSKQVIVGFENAVIGLKVGETITVTIPAAQAYGEYNEALVSVMDRSAFPTDKELEVGLKFQGTTSTGTRIYTIIAFDETTVTVDGNHELAGKELTFEITLVEIVAD